jgi:hypothetical protein|uniref:Uncharacterized protein n=1 Tax=viral metagenome TaxID=1070528 RepID=A0A6H1ZBV7_9ZZZZ
MSDYDMSIHTNPDAVAWARFYRETKAKSPRPENFDNEENMVGWFSNAMMAMHDHLTGQHPVLSEIPNAAEKIVKLWRLLDDIDTLDDACRSNDAAFRAHTRNVQRERFHIVSGDEFDALVKVMKP